ncbi:MAG: ribosomal-processing cysteine protease Prp [Caldibacillus debilis]|jgi:uncharacterized protein YsxB (DUF464 family)|uniref:Ribosomal processing cysteine protease Prp n=2 Tax=Caldibacillus debilis TaxID=301148 RepID=A0A420VC12_9BACI|nr:ribosomal-processing cysteine protease Prp [Caldibacillus debilis]MBO2480839.1 ribosomal-processing cysteine protease Prp [Bacillaceae bacterium]MBY6271635.1 ribosomal-processing cysteine protease Prp [Bacillaceae bacterium]OUM85802.1 MAG: hypothetical protein BAA03_03855 [Caldibacillus debilis]REJ26279.1 MAG: ribosomal-processing cysteine protease Prp [Caldibacillus debilis]RKO61090.1 putative ribosomal protein [Caldibacillus debilis GB1]
MIKVTVHQSERGEIAAFTVEGHANFARYGSDLVCAGVSAVVFGALNGIVELTGVVPKVEEGGEGGYLHCEIPGDVPEEKRPEVDLLLKAMVVSLRTIEKDYGKYIRITFQR